MSKDKSHLVPAISSRGFKHMPVLQARHCNETVRVYESSNANAPHIWLSVGAFNDVVASVQLDFETLDKLIQQLRYLRYNHYQGR